MNPTNLLDKILNSKLVDKNILVAILLIILVGLNLLGIDIAYISGSNYILSIFVIVNILITAILYPLTNYRLNNMNISLEQLQAIADIIEKSKEDHDTIKSRLNFIDTNISNIIKNITDLSSEIRGLPNIKSLKLLLDFRTRGLWNEIFRECLQYTLTFHLESSAIVLSTFNNNFKIIVTNYIEFFNKNLKIYNITNQINENLENKINDVKQLIIDELTTSKKIDEKLYIISIILKNMQDDINCLIIEYLRSIQTQL